MKLKQKLVDEYIEGLWLSPIEYDDLRNAYLAGFYEARRLAQEKWHHDDLAYGSFESELGEEEVL